MYIKSLLITSLLIFLLGCSDSSPNDTTDPFTGSWLSNCHEILDNNGVFISYAIKSLNISNFTSISNTTEYTDINCTVANGSSSLLTETYVIGEQVITTDGSTAERITFISEHVFNGGILTVIKELVYRITGVELNFGDYVNGRISSLDYSVTYVKQ